MARKPSGLLNASKPRALAPVDDAMDAKRAGREGKKMIAVWADLECARALRMLAAAQDTTIQDLVLRGIDSVFRENGLPEIASAKRQSIAA